MKKLTIIRHAKSSWEHNLPDHERPLNDRGESDSILLSSYLSQKGINPDKVLISDATRTRLTADKFIYALNIPEKIIEFNHDLYDFSGHGLIKVIKSVQPDVHNLMVFGHNHAITAFVNSYGDKYIENVPTCGIVQIEFSIDDWKNLKPGKTVFKLFPKDIK